MNTTERQTLPRRIVVKEVIASRYLPGTRPSRWDDRSAGSETIRTSDGEELVLFSNGGQSSPAPGWELLLTSDVGESSSELAWTLYGLQRDSNL